MKELKSVLLPDGTTLTIGDSVRIKEETADPDFEDQSIGGWQGRVTGIYKGEEDDVLLDIVWDSLTLKSMTDLYLSYIEESGLDFSTMVLDIDCVELISTRDNESNRQKAIKEIEKKIPLHGLDEQERRIVKILKGVGEYDYKKSFQKWKTHLAKTLIFPFDALISEYQERGSLKFGDVLNVKKISSVEEQYGIIVEASLEKEKYYFPLCDLDVVDKNSVNFEVVNDYSTWFANR